MIMAENLKNRKDKEGNKSNLHVKRLRNTQDQLCVRLDKKPAG